MYNVSLIMGPEFQLDRWPSGKVSVTKAADLGSIPMLPMMRLPGLLIPETDKMVIQWLPCQAPRV